MDIPYLTGYEKLSGSYENAIYSEFDRKMGVAFRNKSFLIHPNPINYDLFGKPFYFTSGTSSYAWNVPFAPMSNPSGGWHKNPSTLVWEFTPTSILSYDHTVFTNAIATTASVHSTSSTDDIVTINRFPSSSYTNGLSINPFVNFLDHSLQTHYLLKSGSSFYVPNVGEPIPDSASVYYIRERYPYYTETTKTNWTVPEKYYKHSVAEIIIEGPSSVDLPWYYNKHSCLRIHNLNHTTASVNFTANPFGEAYSITLPALGCQTIRRDIKLTSGSYVGVPTNYRTGAFQYFWTYETGDPRNYIYYPTYRYQDAITSYNTYNSILGQVFNIQSCHIANNLINVSTIYDWGNIFNISNYSSTKPICGFRRDDSLLYDITQSLFGDVNNSSTLIGDFIHHTGEIGYRRYSASIDLTQSVITFNGYDTIVNDFASASILIYNSGSDLYIKNSITNSYVALTPYGSNLLKTGDNSGIVITLINQTPQILERNIFEYKNTINEQIIYGSSSFTLDNKISSLDRLFSSASIITSGSKKYWYSIPSASYLTASSTTQDLFRWQSNNVATMSALNTVTLGDVLTLKYFGDGSKTASQDTDGIKYTDIEAHLTTEGLVIKANEKFDMSYIPQGNFHFFSDPNYAAEGSQRYYLSEAVSGSFLVVPRLFRFRGHGWGYGQEGRRNTLYYPPGYPRYTVNRGVSYRISGSQGTDTVFDDFQFDSSPTNITNLRKVKDTLIGNPIYADRYWYNGSQDALNGANITTEVHQINNYNNLARFVNSIKWVYPIDYRVLMFGIWSFVPNRDNMVSDPYYFSSVIPMPFDTFQSWASNQDYAGHWEGLYNYLGITVYDSGSIISGSILQNPQETVTYYSASISSAYHDVGWEITGTFQYLRGQCDITMALADFTKSVVTTATDVAVQDRNAINITTYNGIRYVKLNDIKTALNGLLIPFNYFEICYPYDLEYIDYKDTFVNDTIGTNTVPVEIAKYPSGSALGGLGPSDFNALTITGYAGTNATLTTKYPQFHYYSGSSPTYKMKLTDGEVAGYKELYNYNLYDSEDLANTLYLNAASNISTAWSGLNLVYFGSPSTYIGPISNQHFWEGLTNYFPNGGYSRNLCQAVGFLGCLPNTASTLQKQYRDNTIRNIAILQTTNYDTASYPIVYLWPKGYFKRGDYLNGDENNWFSSSVYYGVAANDAYIPYQWINKNTSSIQSIQTNNPTEVIAPKNGEYFGKWMYDKANFIEV